MYWCDYRHCTLTKSNGVPSLGCQYGKRHRYILNLFGMLVHSENWHCLLTSRLLWNDQGTLSEVHGTLITVIDNET